jgi:hypothetical protein
MNQTLLKILTNSTLLFFLGAVAGYFIATMLHNEADNEKNELEENEEMDGYGHSYFVKLPDPKNPKPIEILIENPIALNDIIVLDNIKYKVGQIEHKVNGHTIIYLSYQ